MLNQSSFTLINQQNDKPVVKLFLFEDNSLYMVYKSERDDLLAVAVLHANNSREAENKNIAVTETLQQTATGSWLLTEIEKMALSAGYQSLIVGTPDTAIKQLQFYEKNGFKRSGIRQHFYIDNYKKPIIEAGIQLRDMQVLEWEPAQNVNGDNRFCEDLTSPFISF